MIGWPLNGTRRTPREWATAYAAGSAADAKLENGGGDEEQREKEETIDEVGETVDNDRANSTCVMDPDFGLDDCAHMSASSR